MRGKRRSVVSTSRVWAGQTTNSHKRAVMPVAWCPYESPTFLGHNVGPGVGPQGGSGKVIRGLEPGRNLTLRAHAGRKPAAAVV